MLLDSFLVSFLVVRLVFSNFKDEEKAMLQSKAKALGAEVFEAFDHTITHVVCVLD
jgi:hypothetical protein